MWNLATKRKIQALKGNKNTFMPDIGDLLTYRHASWIKWLTDKQLICKKKHCSENYCNCIVIWGWWWCQFDMIINVSISAKKLSLVRLFPVQHFSWWLNKTDLVCPEMVENSLWHIFQQFIGLIWAYVPIDDEKKTRSANVDLNPKSVTFWHLMTYLCGSIT